MHSGARFDAVVVGAGVFGLAAALDLARRGSSVAVVDRFGSGHPATSSTGASRSIRLAYGEPFYVDLATAAVARWQELEREAGTRILHLTGQVDLGPDGVLKPIVAAVGAAGGEIERLPSSRLRGLLSELAPDCGSGRFHRRAGRSRERPACTATRFQGWATSSRSTPGPRAGRTMPWRGSRQPRRSGGCWTGPGAGCPALPGVSPTVSGIRGR